MADIYCFAAYRMDIANRRLERDGAPVDLSARAFDALALLVRDPGALVTKDRFMAEVWRGVPVTDEALTQCIRTLRRDLGDDAARPRFIETVPKHGYRFVAVVDAPSPATARSEVGGLARIGTAAMLGGGAAGLAGGLAYGFALASSGAATGGGLISLLLVLGGITALIGLLGGAGIGVGIGAAERWAPAGSPWLIVGGALGGLLVGGLVKLLGLDAFGLLLGRSPGDITGAPEGALLGWAAGFAMWWASRGSPSWRRIAVAAGLAGGCAGVLAVLSGGRLLGGSLDLLGRAFPGSRLGLGAIGQMFGEAGFGQATQLVTAALEGGLFVACTVASIWRFAGANAQQQRD